MTLTLGAIFVLTSFLVQSNSTYMFAEKESESIEILSPSDSLEATDEMDEMKDVDLLNNIDGSFVNDQQ